MRRDKKNERRRRAVERLKDNIKAYRGLLSQKIGKGITKDKYDHYKTKLEKAQAVLKNTEDNIKGTNKKQDEQDIYNVLGAPVSTNKKRT